MITKEIEINVKTGDAEKSVNSLGDSIEDVGKKAEESGEKGSKGIDKVTESSKKSGKAAKLASLGVKAIGLAFKALGIGLILAVFAKFTQILTNNKTISDALSTTFETISIVLTEVVTSIVDAFTSVSDATDGFNAFGRVIKGIITLALTPLKLSFFTIKLALEEAQLAWEQSLFGDGDQEVIDNLNVKIKQTKKDLADVAAEAVKSGKDVITNFGEAVGEIAELGAAVSDNVSKISVETAIEQAKVNTQLKNSAVLAEARLQGLIEKYDRQAELLRQVRDDDRKSISERIAANEELGRVLDEQAEKQKEQARIRIAAAVSAKKTAGDQVEAQAEIIRATNELAAIEAQVEGFRSEQLVNRNSLLREQKDILAELQEIGKTDIELAKEEAEQLRDNRLEQIELQVEDEVEKFRLLEAARLDFDNRIKEIDNEEQARLDKLAEDEKKRNEELKKADDELAKAKIDQREKNLSSTADVLGKTQQLLGEATAAGKAAGIAQALIDTYQSATSSYNSLSGIPVVGPALGIAAAAAAVASGIANVKQITSIKVPGQSGGGGGGNNISGGGGQQQAQPAFNLVGRSNVNQLQTGIEQQETAPVRAFVVSSNVTTQQEADRATQSQASFG